MEDIKNIDKRIDDLLRLANKEQKRSLNALKKAIHSYNDKLYYEANYDKRFFLCNYNKFVNDVKEMDRENFYMIFIRIPQINLNYHLNQGEKNNSVNFIKAVNEVKSELRLARNNIYKTCDFLIMLVYKSDANEAYKRIKDIKNSKSYWRDYQMTYIKYRKYSSKISKNISACMKQANNVFSGEKREKNEWD